MNRFLFPPSTVSPCLTHTNSTIDKFLGGESPDHRLVAEEWPTFLYDERSGWSINDVRRGLFRGHVLARVGPILSITHHPDLTVTSHTQVALRMYRNKTAVRNDIAGGVFNPKTSKCQGRPPFLKMHNINKVVPGMIAYVAVQVCQSHPSDPHPNTLSLQTYVGLSSMASWGDMDGTFSLIHFYRLILKTLSDEEDPWVVNTMNWWQR